MTAIAVAYLIVLQALLGGVAAGTHAGAGFTLDAFGQIICRGADTGHGPAQDDQQPEHNPDCCTVGCSTSVGSATPPPTAAAPAAQRFALLLRAAVPPAPPAVLASIRSPGNPRAPPLA